MKLSQKKIDKNIHSLRSTRVAAELSTHSTDEEVQ